MSLRAHSARACAVACGSLAIVACAAACPSIGGDREMPLSVFPRSDTIPVGDTIRLLTPDGVDAVRWRSSNPGAVIVSSDGRVVGTAVGTAIVFATSGYARDSAFIAVVAHSSAVSSSAPGLPVFPGAAGFGAATPAGRGGRVVRVTSLEDAGPGTLREALAAAGARTVVFDVAGTITLASDLRVREPFVTLAGQTAPPPGITLRGAGLMIQTHDVLVQHLRIRVGDEPAGPNPENRDALQILGPAAYNVVVDHVSMSWAVDEVASTWYPLRAVTISHCIISEGLSRSSHPEGAHSAGLLIGDRSDGVLVVGNLFAHNNDRNPIAKGGTGSVVVNNVVYDPGYRAVDLTDPDGGGPLLASVVGNVLIPGPSTERGEELELVSVSHTVKPGSRVFLADNLAPRSVLRRSPLLGFDPVVGAPPLWPPALAPRPAAEAERWVLEYAGARPAERDAVDERVVREVRERSGRIIDSQAEVGGWPALAPATRALVLPADPAGDDDADGYTNLEELLHRLAAEVEGRAPQQQPDSR